jgi:poly-gamma-glutamate synthesis protein (capsule biosynthesis protein)
LAKIKATHIELIYSAEQTEGVEVMKIALVGDVMLGRLVNDVLKKTNPIYPWGNTLSILSQVDLRICNLECVLSDIGNPWSATPKIFHFRSDEKNVKTLQVAQIDIVSIANNHVLDYEDDALVRMIDILDSQGILHAGAGKNWQQASKPVLCQVNEEKVGFLAFTDNEEGWEAKTNQPGIFYLPTTLDDDRVKDLLKSIRNLRQEVDFLIISAHWGPNWGYAPPQEHVCFAHALIDAGADLIFGHSGHIFRGIEIYKDRPIIYCAGDFIDDYAVDEIERNDESFIFVLEKDPQHPLKLYLYPSYIDNFQANLANSYRKKSILSKMQKLCGDLGTSITCFSGYAFLEI